MVEKILLGLEHVKNTSKVKQKIYFLKNQELNRLTYMQKLKINFTNI